MLIDCVNMCYHYLPNFRSVCENCEFEMWERMTYGGVINEDGPGVYSMEDCESTCTKERVDAARG